MPKEKKPRFPALVQHGWRVLPRVVVNAYNEELKDETGFSDRAIKGAFREILDRWRKSLARDGEDPVGDTPTRRLTKSQLHKYLDGHDPLATGLRHSAVEEFAGELATVTRRFVRVDEQKDTRHIVVGGGLSGSQVGRLAVGRAWVMLNDDGVDIGMLTIENHPDEAGLLGGIELAPAWMLNGHDAIIAVDIGAPTFASASCCSR